MSAKKLSYGVKGRLSGDRVLGRGPAAVTASVGGASLEPDEDARSWLARADEAMYAAKCSGRNRSIVAKARSAA